MKLIIENEYQIPGTDIILESGDIIEGVFSNMFTDSQTRLGKDITSILIDNPSLYKKFMVTYPRYPEVAAHIVMDYISANLRRMSDEIQDFYLEDSHDEEEMEETWDEVYSTLKKYK